MDIATIALIIAVPTIGFLAVMVFMFALDALPVAIAIAIGAFAHRHGWGLFGSVAVGLVCMLTIIVVGFFLTELTGSPPMRLGMATLFAAIIAGAGYSVEYGIALQCTLPAAWAEGIALAAAVVLGSVAAWRVAIIKPEPEEEEEEEAQPGEPMPPRA